ncbi:hypothetical protein ACRAWG_27045 [Methylobacterium sp. P31]
MPDLRRLQDCAGFNPECLLLSGSGKAKGALGSLPDVAWRVRAAPGPGSRAIPAASIPVLLQR